MSIFQRAARLAALALSLTGFLSASSAGYASEVERSVAPSALSSALNAPAPTAVPEAVAAIVTSPASNVSFASLSDAIAAQDGGIDDEHVRCLAGAIYFESKGEPLAGQLAVAQVIINRTRSGRFASDVCGVVKQPGQFSFVHGGRIPEIDGSRLAYRTAVAVAKVALGKAWDEQPAPEALYFNGARSSHSGAKRVALIGNHAFYR